MSNQYKPYFSKSLNKELLMERSTIELEKIGKKFKIDLDRRVKKSTLVDQLYKVL